MRKTTARRTRSTDEHRFGLRLTHAEDLSIIRLNGNITLEQGGAFESRMTRLALGLRGTVVLDLSGLDFINVIGLGVIVRAGNAIRRQGGRLMLSAAQPHICHLIQAVRLYDLFPYFDMQAANTPYAAGLELAHCA